MLSCLSQTQGAGFAADDFPGNWVGVIMMLLHNPSICSIEEASDQGRSNSSAASNHPGIVDVAPLPGRLVVFLSGAIDHAVLPAVSSRIALTCWLR